MSTSDSVAVSARTKNRTPRTASGADLRELLRWAIMRIAEDTKILAECHTHPVDGLIYPAQVRDEVEAARQWLRQARKATRT